MRSLVSVVGGFCVTLVVFACGALTAVFFVNAEPVTVRSLDMNTSALWTNKAVRVDASASGFERLPARPAQDRWSDHETAPEEKDRLATAAILPEATPQLDVATNDSPDLAVNDSHVKWCSERYRSYDQVDNSYNAYSGARRQCISPYSEEVEETGSYIEAAAYGVDEQPSGYASSDHVQSCFDRYLSYRPEDNSYQPYGGGPRLQCE
jgi:hypothetical protein